jgi:hypothetical protein
MAGGASGATARPCRHPSSRGRWPHRSSTTGQTPDMRSVAHLEPKEPPVRPGRVQIRPLGGWPGCLVMILFSVVASVVGTVLLNLLL